jgi:hypothetical protein
MTTRPGYVWDATASEWVEIGQAAVLAPIAYQTSAPSSPATGDIWIDSDDEVPSVDSTLYYRWTKTMSGGETSLSGTDNNSLALKYTPGYESVFINGVLQVRGSDYVATTGTTVTGLTALTANDVVMVESIIAYSVGDTYTQTTLNTMFSPITTTGLVLLNTTTFTAQSTVSIDNVFTSTYANYLVLLNHGDPASSQTITMRMRASGADDSTGNYYRMLAGLNAGGVTALTGAATAFTLGYAGGTSGLTAEFTVMNPQLVAKTTIQGTGVSNNSAFNGITGYRVGGWIDNTTQYSGLSILLGANATGTIKVYGYK